MFKGTSNIFNLSTSEIIDINLKYWLDYSFLNIGAFWNVNIPTSGIYGGDLHRLYPVHDPSYTDGQVWKAARGNWVWESGTFGSPIRVSGAFVNGSLSTDLYVDYSRGRVVFDTAQSTSSTITAEYSYKWINVYSADEVDWFNNFQFDSFRFDRFGFGIGSGELEYDRIQAPMVIYEHISKTFRPYQLGLGQYSDNDIIFHIISEDRHSVDKIADILSEQNYKTIHLFDAQMLSESGVYPLNYRGELNDGALTYDQLVVPKDNGGYRWRKMSFFDANRQKTNKLDNNLYHCPVRFRAELALTDI